MQSLPVEFQKVHHQAYSTIEYEIFNIKNGGDYDDNDYSQQENDQLENGSSNSKKNKDSNSNNSSSNSNSNNNSNYNDQEESNALPSYDELARFLLDSEEFEQHDAISKVITEQFKSKVINRTSENEEAIAIETARLTQLLQLHHKNSSFLSPSTSLIIDDTTTTSISTTPIIPSTPFVSSSTPSPRVLSDEIVRHVSTSLSNFERIETLAILLKESKRYNLELLPKLMSCRGELIELLISSGVGRYLDFKAMETTYIFTRNDDAFEKVIPFFFLLIHHHMKKHLVKLVIITGSMFQRRCLY